MKFSIGDPVRLKQSGEEGIIVDFLGLTMAAVSLQGVSIPVHLDELEHPYFHWFTNKKPAPRPKHTILPEIPETRAQRLESGIYLSFFPEYQHDPDDSFVTGFRIDLLNETTGDYQFQYQVRAADKTSIFNHSGLIHSFGKIYLHRISLEDLNAQARFHWSLAEKGCEDTIQAAPLLIRPAQLVKWLEALRENKEPMFFIRLSDEIIQANSAASTPEKLKEAWASSISLRGRPGSSNQEPNTTATEHIVDLHWDKLTLNTGQEAVAILEQQLHYLERRLGAALAANLPDMLIIHGIGEGTLKARVHELLASYPSVSEFRNEWMPRYGMGATRVWFKV